MIERARAILRGASRIVSFTGAGLSAESGIATFRDESTHALWSRYDPMKLASPQGFAEDPRLVIEWYNWRRSQIARAEPNGAHRALANSSDMLHITQNVDDLLERAGAYAANVLHLHGTMSRDRCHAHCGFEELIDCLDAPGLRSCPQCDALVRPSVVWFGEALPADVWKASEQACTTCDVLLVVGTSAEVYPAAGLIEIAASSRASVIVINTKPSKASSVCDVELIGPAGDLLPACLEVQINR